MPPAEPQVAVIGHVEHVTIARVAALPGPGEIVHVDAPQVIPGGGGGIAFHQLARSPGVVHLFTAFGNDDAAREVEAAVRTTGARIHAARRDAPQTRDLALITPAGERTIFVIGRPLHPRIDDPLPWGELDRCDGVYFTGDDPATIEAARNARVLVVTARRAGALARSGVRADVVVGSRNDARETSALGEYDPRPHALVMTEGERGGTIETADGVVRFRAAPPPMKIIGSYGAGDSFAAALTWYLARGVPIAHACERASVHAAAVLGGINPLERQTALA